MSSFATPQSYRTMRIAVTTSLLGALAACSTKPPIQTDASAAVSMTSSLTGSWHGSNDGLTVDLTVVQAGDSVTGTGSYSIAPTSSIGCGGESLSGTGAVTLRGNLSGAELTGRMSFAGSWTPPYLGTVLVRDSINGHFMSIDRGGCPLILVRQHQG
jgi:hypothetical protein